MVTLGRCVLPLPLGLGSAALDFELAGRKLLQRWVPWCPLGFGRSPKLLTCLNPGHTSSGTSSGYSPEICKSDANVAFGGCGGVGQP
ncbi:hypothetical protein P7K49_015419, partial [Saguinus oedipus]